jgi:hypothetical protein
METPVTRDFTPHPAQRGEDVLQIGLMGPPGGGKTWSALELATGMQRVRGGEIILLETEGKRSLKLADHFKFLRVGLEPPYNPLMFRDAILAQQARKPACIIVDSLSDEHEGPGGVLSMHDDYVDAKAGDDWSKRERISQSAWIIPKRERLSFINAMYRIETPLIFCFRAREKVKPVKNERGKMEPTNVGYQPIAPIEIVHSLDLTCLLPANARGVPEWRSDKAGEDFFIKLPGYLLPYVQEGKKIDADLGEAFAKWMKGTPQRTILDRANDAAGQGVSLFREFYKPLSAADKAALKPHMGDLERKAKAADAPQGIFEPPAASAPPPPPVAPQAAAQEAAGAVSFAVLVDRLKGCTTLDGVQRVKDAAESLPPDQRAELHKAADLHASWLQPEESLP